MNPASTLPADGHYPVAELPPHSDARLQGRRTNRLRIVAMVAACYLLDTALLLGFWAVGAIGPEVPLMYAATSMPLCGLFYLLHASGWTERLADHYATTPLLAANTLLNLGFIVWVPQVGFLFVLVLFIIFGFSGLRMSRRSVLVSAAAIAVIVGNLVFLIGDQLAMPTATAAQRAMSGLWFALVFARSALLGLYGTHLRGLLKQRNALLATTSERLDALAHRDELTGALNRRSVMKMIEMERQRMLRNGEAFGVALLDLDHFKQINDRFGHLVGDEVLRQFTEVASAGMRGTDGLGRYGGEEFVLLLANTSDKTAAIKAAERVRHAVAAHDWNALAPGLQLSVSGGVAICEAGETAEHLLLRADMALYVAKADGRNCVRSS